MTPLYTIVAECPDCGGPLQRTNQTRANSSLLVGIVACPTCSAQYELTVRLASMAWTKDECRSRHRVKAMA